MLEEKVGEENSGQQSQRGKKQRVDWSTGGLEYLKKKVKKSVGG